MTALVPICHVAPWDLPGPRVAGFAARVMSATPASADVTAEWRSTCGPFEAREARIKAAKTRAREQPS